MIIGHLPSVRPPRLAYGWSSVVLIVRVTLRWWVLKVTDRIPASIRHERSHYPVVGDATPNAHGASTHARRVVHLQRLWLRFAEHLVVLDGGQPVGCRSGEVVARA